MEYRNLGRSGLSVSEISLGSWLTFGSSIDREGTRELVHKAYDLGINLFDTADVYSNGQGEEALGYALQGIPRHYVVIASKCFFPMSEHPNDRGLSRKHIVESVEGSLRRLGTDYVDLLQCHRPDPTTPIEETVRAFEDLIRQGKVLYWGVSEWRAAHVVDACRIADRAAPPLFNTRFILLEAARRRRGVTTPLATQVLRPSKSNRITRGGRDASSQITRSPRPRRGPGCRTPATPPAAPCPAWRTWASSTSAPSSRCRARPAGTGSARAWPPSS